MKQIIKEISIIYACCVGITTSMLMLWFILIQATTGNQVCLDFNAYGEMYWELGLILLGIPGCLIGIREAFKNKAKRDKSD